MASAMRIDSTRTPSPTPVYDVNHVIYLTSDLKWADLVEELTTYRIRVMDEWDRFEDMPQNIQEFSTALEELLKGPEKDVEETLIEWQAKAKGLDNELIPDLIIQR
ncbi:MAG: hypothetical protein K1X28_07685 [Parachlamydiales bacterium]|nr:hypothetical protein [Parachlamydiales bacterium]